MTTQQMLLTVDFGADTIRVTRSRGFPGQPNSFIPQIVLVDGNPELWNAAILRTDLQNVTAVGQSIYRLGRKLDLEEITLTRLSLAGVTEQEKYAVQTLLEEIVKTMELDQLASEDLAATRTYLITPIGAKKASDEEFKVLQQAGFPWPIGIPGEYALLHGFFNATLKPGKYLLLDFGLRATRAAVVQVSANGKRSIEKAIEFQPGGADIERLLAPVLRVQLAAQGADTSDAAVDYAMRIFLPSLSRAWGDGKAACEILLPDTDYLVSLPIDRLLQIIDPVITAVNEKLQAFVISCAIPVKDVTAVLLAGGGAAWPFASKWAISIFGPAKMQRADYPKEVLVKGAAYAAAYGEPEEKKPLNRVKPVKPVKVEKTIKPFKPGRAFLMEFLGGLVGILGLGWYFELKSMIGCGTLLGWWAIILAAVLGLGGISLISGNTQPLIWLLPIWIGIPLLSGVSAFLRARQSNCSILRRE